MSDLSLRAFQCDVWRKHIAITSGGQRTNIRRPLSGANRIGQEIR